MHNPHPSRRHLLRWTLLPLSAALPLGGVQAHGKPQLNSATAAPIDTEQMPWGVAAAVHQATRVVDITMTDTMRFSPSHLEFKHHDTVHLRVINSGALLHELVLGTEQALAEHAAMMRKHPTMEHDAAYMAHVAPRQRGDITWTFNRLGVFAFACLIPGHSEAGMRGTLRVTG
jgi:uncharacterized cupredoxin-like copper-binding protein